jgi:3-oxoacyl-(acyl-carrier-protein) synthase
MSASQLPAVWVAGAGCISAAGGDIPETLDSFAKAKRNPATALPFESSIKCPTFQVNQPPAELDARHNECRSLRLAMHATRQAMADGGFGAGFEPGTRVGVCMGTTVASQLNNIAFYDAVRRNTEPALDPVYNYLHANLGQAMSKILAVSGPRITVVNACSSGTDAIGIASQWIRGGLCDVAIAGGADEMNRVALAGFWSLGVMSTEPCAPFDRNRAGLNLGEGAGVLVLESTAHAKKRGRNASFEIAGFGAACDAHHLTAPHPEGRGLDKSIRVALAQAGIEPGKISFINAHGTATNDNDRAEGNVIARIFGAGTPFLSTKGFTGHTLGAAGGLEAVFTLLGLREGWIPPSMGFANAADDIPVSPVSARTKISGEYAMSTSLAFGGNNSAVVIRRLT